MERYMFFILAAATMLQGALHGAIAQHSTAAERSVIRIAKQVDVSRLDNGLPSGMTFGDWFGKTVGQTTTVRWEVNDCGEQTGTPADRQRHIPTCAEAQATLADKRVVVVMISVGSPAKRGASREISLRDCFIERVGEYQTIKRLRDLPAALTTKH